MQRYNTETEEMIQRANNDFLSVSNISNYKVIFEKYKTIKEQKPMNEVQKFPVNLSPFILKD